MKHAMRANIVVLSFIMLINAMAYGTIIPLLYPYASRFGIHPLGLSLLFASYAFAQLLATPIIGRLSDRYGRKLLLVFCILGTSISLGMFAAAKTVAMLFVSRIIDGITGGNVSVAQAVIADSAKPKERAKYFGILGAAFGFGFLFGPAMGALMSRIDITAPFWFASGLAFIATLTSVFFLKETHTNRGRQKKKKTEPLFRISHYIEALFSPTVGVILMISFLANLGFNAWIIGFQSFTVDVLKLRPQDIGLIFALSGLIGIIMQAVGIRLLLRVIPSKKHVLTLSLFSTSLLLLGFFYASSFVGFLLMVLLFMLFTAPQGVTITALLSERTLEEDQGGVLGINQSYMSLGQIIGPLLAGLIASRSVSYVFLLTSVIFIMALLAMRPLYASIKRKTDL